MGIFDFALVKEEEKEKKLVPGWAQRMRGIGKIEEPTGTGTLEAEGEAGAKAVGKFDFALKPVLLPTIEQEEKELKDLETTYEALNNSITADYNQYVDLQKELEELGLSLQEVPEELTWYLQKKFEEVKATHNSLVDKIKADTAEQKTIYDSYTVARKKYEEDVDVYNRFANATKKRTEPFIPSDYSPEEVARQLKEGTYVTGKKPDTLRTVLGAYATFGKSLSLLPKSIRVTFLQAVGGKDAAGINDTKEIDTLLKDMKDIDEFIKEAYMRYGSEGIFGIKITDLAELARNMGYSVTSMGAGVAVGIPLALIPFPGMRVAAWAAGTAASGVACYRATEFQIMQSYLEFKNEESIKETGKPITLEEEKLLKGLFAADAKTYALWEALPEAISNLNFGLVLTKPLTKVAGKRAASFIINKLGRYYVGEFSTEMITQMGQAGVEVKAGMRVGPPPDWTKPRDYIEALKEIAPQTFLLTTVMGGAGATVVETSKAFGKITKSLKAEVGENHPLLKLMEAKLIGQLVEQRGSFSWKDTSKKPEGKRPKNIEEAKEQLIKRGVREEFLTPEFMKKFMESPMIQELEKADVTGISEEEALEEAKDLEEIEASAEELIAAAKDVEPTADELDKIKKVDVAKERFVAALEKPFAEKKRAAKVEPSGVFYVGKIEVIKNPSPRQFEELKKEYRQESRLEPTGFAEDNPIRFIKMKDKSLYIFRADISTHGAIEDYLIKEYVSSGEVYDNPIAQTGEVGGKDTIGDYDI